jgi:glycosyltransferase involved in cell wall biosynthesis
MKLSIIVCTRNRANAIPGCLRSIQAAIANASVDAEIVVVDNGSTDETPSILKAWATSCPFPVQLLTEPKAGLARARNTALRASRADLFAFTDDDCRMDKEYINDLLRYDAADTDPVLRGGRIELGDPTDLPHTINTTPTRMRWSRSMNSARHDSMNGKINGCNMTMRRSLVERLGLFDEDFGPGSPVTSGEDTEYFYRAYCANAAIEYVPDMAVAHHHGRKTRDDGYKLWRSYATGNGAIYAKYILKHPNLCRAFYWDCKNALKEIVTRHQYFFTRCRLFSQAQGGLCPPWGGYICFQTQKREATHCSVRISGGGKFCRGSLRSQHTSVAFFRCLGMTNFFMRKTGEPEWAK